MTYPRRTAQDPAYTESRFYHNWVFRNCIVHVDTHPGRVKRRLTILPFVRDLWLDTPPPDVTYDPTAECPSATERFWNLAFPDPDQRRLAFEMFGYVLWHGMNPPALFVLYGPGGSGKTTVTDLLSAIVGERNVSGVSLSGFLGEPGHSQEMAMMDGKRLNISDESGESVRNVNRLAEVLKMLSGGGRAYYNHKYGQDRAGRNTAKLIFCSNVYPSLGSDSGTARRLHILTMDRPFEISPEDRDVLFSEQSLTWMAMEALRAYLGYLDRGCTFTSPPKSQAEKIRVLLGSDILIEFLESDDGLGTTDRDAVRARLLNDEDYDVNLRIVLYSRYCRYCDSVGIAPLSKNSFFQRIDIVYGVKAGNKCRIYRWEYEVPGTKYDDIKNFAQVRRFIDAEVKQ